MLKSVLKIQIAALVLVRRCFSSRLEWSYGLSNHVRFAHSMWADIVRPGDIAIDATCGNGYDSLKIAQLLLGDGIGKLYCIDIQEDAISNTKNKLKDELSSTQSLAIDDGRISFVCRSHESFPEEIKDNSVALVCYNLGYLPGKKRKDQDVVITKTQSTISSMEKALMLLKRGGMLSIIAYPGNQTIKHLVH